MITIYKSHSMKDAAAYVMGVLDNVDKSNLDVTHTVIVPDRASMEAERALLQNWAEASTSGCVPSAALPTKCFLSLHTCPSRRA